MGLKVIPERDSIIVHSKGVPDAWGLNSVEPSEVSVRCYIREAEATTPVESIGGKQVIPSFTVSINGDSKIAVGDFVEVNGIKMVVLNRQPKKDLSGKVLFTKFVV